MKSLKIIFFGSPYYSVPLLDKTIELGHDVSLVVSQGTTKTRRGKVIKTPVHQCCEEKNIKYILPDRFSDSVIKKIMSSNYDLGIIYSYGKLVPKSLIDHLDGKIFVDYLSDMKRSKIEKGLTKQKNNNTSPQRTENPYIK